MLPDSVTILIATYNEEDFVDGLISSLRHQLWFCEVREIIVVDSGSTDKTVEKLSKIATRIIQTPRGKLTSLNTGVEEARGDIIVEMDADTYYPRNWLYHITLPLRNARVVAVTGWHIILSPFMPLRTLRSMSMADLWLIYGGNCAYRRDVFLSMGGFDESVDQFNFWEIRREEEFEFRRKMEKFGEVIFTPRAIAFRSNRRARGILFPTKYSQEIAKGERF
jgi:glycosyltransferase involved in cell wall biosynthesis